MTKGENNNDVIRGFVFEHDLMNRFSIIQFNAIVTITTAINKVLNRQMTVMITLDGDIYGEVSLFDTDLDPYLYPTVLKARYQDMNHVDKEYLEVKDNHPTPAIGKYKVKIFPLERLRD